MQRVLMLCVLAVLSTVSLASDEKALAASGVLNATGAVAERGMPALFSWGDFDGDGRLDLAALGGDGALQLLASTREGCFEDVTEHARLSGVENTALALWADYDGDGRLDLFVGAREGKSRLFRNEGGVFMETSATSGLRVEGAVHSAHWLDHDGDGHPDLHVVSAQGHELFRGKAGGFFDRLELPAVVMAGNRVLGGVVLTGSNDGAVSGAERSESPSGPVGEDGDGSVSRAVVGYRERLGGANELGSFPAGCANSIEDDANPGTCLQASTTPTLGRLHPISANLFVAVSGEVGIGTTSPSARLHVAGTARITDTLTLAPSGDQALNLSTGNIYKGGALFLHTTGGANTGLGREALASVSIGFYNTASGDRALFANTSGFANTASGASALRSSSVGSRNTALGASALRSNTTGNRNTASGSYALFSNTTGLSNTATGDSALFDNTTGYRNTAMGASALRNNTNGYRNTAMGASALQSNTIGDRNTACGGLALYSNTTGVSNTASGVSALHVNTTGSYNTASGAYALRNNTTGYRDTAMGASALRSNTSGNRNTASGNYALFSNTTGIANTASGDSALRVNTTGSYNTATGYFALGFSTGSRNIALGYFAGVDITTGSNNIAIGNYGGGGESGTIRIGNTSHTRAFIAGIRGVTTGIANAIPVLIDSAGQLGTVSSSRRFKEEITDMGDLTDRLLELRPVAFRYKAEVQAGERPLEYGLIAEEVAEVFPDLVVYDEDGKPFTVKYHLLSSMLLNELEKMNAKFTGELEDLRNRLAAVETRASHLAQARELPPGSK